MVYMLSQLSWTYTSKENTKYIQRTSNERQIVLSLSYRNCFTIHQFQTLATISIQIKFFILFFIEIYTFVR